jgi:broad specificity phosphatase PhoE
MIIKLVRHGESRANVDDAAPAAGADHLISLTPRGIAQAREAGRTLGKSYLTASLIYTSPFRRARQTMASILEGAGLSPDQVSVWEDPRLREVDHGYFDVAGQHDLVEKYGHFYYRYRGGESAADCYDRVSGFLDTFVRSIKSRRSGQALLVTHGLALRVFVMRFLHLTVEQFDKIANPHNADIVTLALRETIQAPQFVSGRWGVEGLRKYTES